MTDAPVGKVLFYPVWVSNSGRVSLRWGKPCDAPGEANAVGKAEVEAGRATLSFVVEFSEGEKKPLASWTHPPAARKIIKHWEALWEATEGDGR